MGKENIHTRMVFNFVVDWCKPLDIVAIATDFTRDVIEDAAILVLVKHLDGDLSHECSMKMDRELDTTCQLIISDNRVEYEGDKELFEVEDVVDYAR